MGNSLRGNMECLNHDNEGSEYITWKYNSGIFIPVVYIFASAKIMFHDNSSKYSVQLLYICNINVYCD